MPPNLHDVKPETIDGVALLDEVHAFLGRFVAFPSMHAHVAVTLWAAHTHLTDRFDSTPRLALLSPEKQSGKSRTLEVLESLAAAAEMLNDASAAYLYRRIGDGQVTVLLDEADAIWKRGKSDEAAETLRSIVNQGHRKRGSVGRVDMNGKKAELVKFPVYAPVALAGIGNCLPDTVLDRAVIVSMRRRAPDERVDQYRERTCREPGEQLGARLADWAAEVADKVGCPWPDMPDGVSDRPADVWEPMLTVAELAGGDWPERARAACVAFVTGSRDDTASVGVRLLGDIRGVFGDAPVLASAALLDALHRMDEAPWGDWYGHQLTNRELARMLKPYGIKSTKVRIGESTPRGYRREDFQDAWSRYLPNPSGTCGTSGTVQVTPVPDDFSVPEHPEHEESDEALFRNTETQWNSLTSHVPHVPDVPRGFPNEEEELWHSASSGTASSADAPSDPATSAPGTSSATNSPASTASPTDTTRSKLASHCRVCGDPLNPVRATDCDTHPGCTDIPDELAHTEDPPEELDDDEHDEEELCHDCRRPTGRVDRLDPTTPLCYICGGITPKEIA